LRALPRLHLRPPRLQERLIIGMGHLPTPLARAAFGFGFRVKALLRCLLRPYSPPAGGGLGNVQPKPLHHIAEQASS